MNQADLTKELRNKLWTEAVRCANVLENITATSSSAESPYELFLGKKSDLYDHLIEFGRIAYVNQRKKIKVNWKDTALRGIMAGYAEGRSRDTYRVYMYNSREVVEIRDIQ